MVIYKVYTKKCFTTSVLSNLIEEYNFILLDNVLYIAPENYKTEDRGLKQVFNSDDYMYMSLENLEYEHQTVKDWADTVNFVHSKQKWEDENQEEIRTRLNRLEEFEKFIQEGGECIESNE